MISARGLSKRYGSTLAVNDLSFDVKAGEVTGFLGPNGAGKSTTMRLILGLDRPASGTATINGKRYAELANPLREVGSVLDAKQVNDGRTGRNHLRWMAASNGIARSRVDEVLEMVGLTSAASKRAGGYSLGMSQRLGIAGALLGDPGVLMFDEPVNGLDPEGIVWIRTFMQHLAGQGRTVFVSSHLLSEMSQTASHLIVIGRGQLIADTSTAEVIRSSSSNFTRVRAEGLASFVDVLKSRGLNAELDGDAALVEGAETDVVGRLAAEVGVTLLELSAQRASLEEAFMELTRDAVEYHADPSIPGHAGTEGGTQ
ncbi:MAG: ATP-binding cassette domain-containing protein [Candidatus Nanopelagicales bacterium]